MQIAPLSITNQYNQKQSKTPSFGHKLGPGVKQTVLGAKEVIVKYILERENFGSNNQTLSGMKNEAYGRYMKRITEFLNCKFDATNSADIRKHIENIEKYGTEEEKKMMEFKMTFTKVIWILC